MLRLPYAARPGQAELVADIHGAQREGLHFLAEAGTGTGKTVSALTASLSTCLQDGRRLVYATRTNSQQAQVVREHKALLDAGQDVGLLVPLMGRRQYCPLLRRDERYRDGTAEELGKLCRDAKRKAQQEVETGRPVAGACPYYARLLRDGEGPVEALLAEGGLDGAELGRRIEDAGSCPYEALKRVLPRARTVVLPLVFVLDGRLRQALLQWLGTGADGCHLVLDEAHHLPAAAREHHTLHLSHTTLQRAQKEAEEFQDPVLAGTTLTTTLLDAVLAVLHATAREWVRGEDGLVPPGTVEEALLTRLRVPTPQLARIVQDLERWGEAIREDRRAKGRLPRSYLGSVATFLRLWWEARDAPYIQLVTGGDEPTLEMFLLDPAAVLDWLGEFASTTHMSGTLAPIEEHRALCGLLPERTRTRTYPSPFDPANLRLYGIDGMDRRYEAVQKDPGLVERQQQVARALLRRKPPRKTGLWFPSHEMAQEYLEEGFLHGVGHRVHVEEAGMTTPQLSDLVRRFRADPDPGAILVGVLGGRLTEGLDFPGDALERVLVFGIPYPRPSARTQALVHHYDARDGQGWAYAVHNPVARTLRQAIGRLIRGPGDRGTAVVLDERIVRFRSLLPALEMVRTPEEVRDPDAAPALHDGYRTADQIALADPSFRRAG
ncbi:MAG TPA: ATP-dependent DNA helicase [Candidatus Thermoplasmatota archaeon]|nr:ATP-dependent DNA helicase [Candidatus Thermoplasmatota archaeon]